MTLMQDLLDRMREADRRGIDLPRRDRVGVDADLMRELIATPSEPQPMMTKLGAAHRIRSTQKM